MKQRSATWLVTLCFLLSAGGGGVFIAAYVLDWGPQVLGGVMAGAVAALAVGLLLWSAKLLPSGTYVEAREPLPPPRSAQTALIETAERGGEHSPKIVRRTLVLSLFGLCAAAVVPLRSLIPSDSVVPARALAQTSWRTGNKRLMTPDGKLIKPSDIPVGAFVTAFPEGEPKAYYAQAVVLRLAPTDVPLLSPTFRTGVVDDGLVGLSKMCTHAGCPVGLYEQQARALFCPCHQSVFAVLKAARPIAGPAARPLPQLPLAVDADGYLYATGDFRGQPGPTYWKNYWRPARIAGSS